MGVKQSELYVFFCLSAVLWFGLVYTEDNGSFTSVISTLNWVCNEMSPQCDRLHCRKECQIIFFRGIEMPVQLRDQSYLKHREDLA